MDKEKSNKSFKNMFNEFLKLVGEIAALITVLTIFYQGLVFVFEIQTFNYWNIDYSFYINSIDIVNSLLFNFYNTCLLLLFIIIIISSNKADKRIKKFKKNLKVFLFIYIYNLITNFHIFFKTEINLKNIIISIFSALFIFIFSKWSSKKLEEIYLNFKNKRNIDLSFKKVIIGFLITIVSVYSVATILGKIYITFKNSYQIIFDNNQCTVVLFSAKDYYIVADCEIDGNNLTVFKDKQRKINNYDITAVWTTFKSVNKS